MKEAMVAAIAMFAALEACGIVFCVYKLARQILFDKDAQKICDTLKESLAKENSNVITFEIEEGND